MCQPELDPAFAETTALDADIGRSGFTQRNAIVRAVFTRPQPACGRDGAGGAPHAD